MRLSLKTLLAVGCLIAVAGSADAQPERRVGLVMGYPASVGVLWPVGDRVALRPDVTINWTRTETTSTLSIPGPSSSVSTTQTGWTTSLGVSGLFYLGSSDDDLRFYLVPRAAYLWTNTEVETSPELPSLGPGESDGSGFQVSGAVGAQYAVQDRFRIFGELGLGYTTQESDASYTLSRTTLKASSLGLRSGIGVVVMF